MPPTLTQGKPQTFQFRDFSKGINQTDARPALQDNEVFWLENVQPIGRGNLQILPPAGASIATIAAGIATLWGINIKLAGVETALFVSVNNDGSMSSITTAGVVTTIAAAGTVTTQARLTMWQDNPLLIGDPTKGYFSWDGTFFNHYPITLNGSTHTNKTIDGITPNTNGLTVGMAITAADLPVGTTITQITSATAITVSNAASGSNAGEVLTVGAGAPTSVIDLSTFEGRVFLVTASRTETLSAPASFTDFTTVDGAFTFTITDSVFVGAITRILSALEVLWTIGVAAVNAISNVQFASGVTTISNTNIVSNVGTPLPSSVTSFFRTFLFLAQYGVYAIVGATPQKLSEQLDGLFPQLTLGADAPAGVVSLDRIFVWCVLVNYTDPATNITKPILLCFSRNAWFVASQGTLTWITSLVNLTTGAPELWGTDGTHIFKCFAGTGAGFYDIKTKSFDFGSFTTRKQMTRFALEILDAPPTFALTAIVSNELGNSSVIPLQTQATIIVFVGSGVITFIGFGAVAIVWTINVISPEGYVNMAGDYLSLELTGTSLPFTISGMAMSIEPAGEWT